MSSSELEIKKAAEGQGEQLGTATAEITGPKEPEAETNASPKADLDFAAAEEYKNQGNDLLKSKYRPRITCAVAPTPGGHRAGVSASALQEDPSFGGPFHPNLKAEIQKLSLCDNLQVSGHGHFHSCGIISTTDRLPLPSPFHAQPRSSQKPSTCTPKP